MKDGDDLLPALPSFFGHFVTTHLQMLCTNTEALRTACMIAWTHSFGKIIHQERLRPKKMAVVRHFAPSALKQLPFSKKTSLKRLRKICAYDTDLLAEAMNFILL